MKRTWMTLLAAAMVTSTLTLAAPAAADPPGTTVEEGIEIFCSFEYGDLQGEVFAFPEYAFFDLSSDGGQLAYYGGGPDIIMDDTALSVAWTLRDVSDTVVGSAAIAATYESVGDPIITDERYRDGNRWVEEHRVSSELVGGGTVTIVIDGQASEVETECGGEAFTTEIWSTNPSAHVTRDSGAYFFCELESEGWTVLVEAEAFEEDSEPIAYLGVLAWSPETDPEFDAPTFEGWSDIDGLEPGPLVTIVELSDSVGDPAGIATVDGEIAYGEVLRSKTFLQDLPDGDDLLDLTLSLTEQAIEVSGTLTLPDARVLDLIGCDGTAWTERLLITQSNGPKPDKGKVPANDLPEGATLLDTRENDQSANAAWEPEASCLLAEGPDIYDVPLGKTLWYVVEGTGEPMTVNTVGTDFDTVVGIYTTDGEEFTQIDCVDDVFDPIFSWQAAATFDTVEGEMYHVQVGGFFSQYGHVKISVE